MIEKTKAYLTKLSLLIAKLTGITLSPILLASMIIGIIVLLIVSQIEMILITSFIGAGLYFLFGIGGL